MARKKPVDLEAVRLALGNLDRIAREHPELVGPPGEANRRGWERTLEEAMPDMKQVAFRLPVDLLDRVDRAAAALAERTPGMPVTRTDAVRVLLTQALDAFEAAAPKKKKR